MYQGLPAVRLGRAKGVTLVAMVSAMSLHGTPEEVVRGRPMACTDGAGQGC